MAKEKKVEIRDVVYQELATLMVQASTDGEAVFRYKEGLRVDNGEDTLIIRVIKKKSAPEISEKVGSYVLQEDGSVKYVESQEKDEE